MIDTKKLDNELAELSFAESLAGTEMIRQAVIMAEAQRGISMTKELYPAIAKAAGSTSQRVERNIRAAIANAIDCCDGWPETRYAWQRFTRGQDPTNGEVIARLVRRCRVED